MDKSAWRDEARRRRRAAVPDSAGHCRALAEFLAELVPPDRRVVVYDAMAGEVDLAALIAADPEPGRRFALTRTPDRGRTLTLHPYDAETERHRFGYRQPVAGSSVVADAEVGAVLVPGLAFDRNGVRLGWGSGYYDRLLARLGPGVLRVGITGGVIVDDLPREDHDVAMTHLATASWVLPVPLAAT